jgi:hypothetical protein
MALSNIDGANAVARCSLFDSQLLATYSREGTKATCSYRVQFHMVNFEALINNQLAMDPYSVC